MDCTSPVLGIYACGKCLNCRARSRQEWVFRIRQEYKSCNFGLFVTLTYDDEKLPPDGVCKRDIQLFLKRLRKHFDSNTLRYFIVSEYGDHTQRAHYHGLLFFNIERKPNIYDIIEQSWQNGFCQFGEIEEGSIVYCTKYCLKGGDSPPGKNENFRLVSKMHGGIGVGYIEEQKEYHVNRLAKPTMAVSQGNTAPLPRYYREKFLLSLPEEERIDIRLLYQEKLREKRDELLQKKLLRFRAKHPELDYWQASEAFYDRQRVIHEEKSKLFDKHTKKQNVL